MKIALLHGFAGDPSAWDAVRAEFPAELETIAIALPGHGGDDQVADGWDANLGLVADRIARDGVRVAVGYSLGARVALGLLAGGAIDRAVLISVNPGIPASDDGERAARRAGDAKWAELLRTRGIAAFADAWAAMPLFATQSSAAPSALAGRRARRLALDPEQLARSLEHMGLAAMPDYREALAGAHDRARLIVGADDAKFVAIARATGLPFAQIAASGHDPTLEQPRQLADAIGGGLMR